ncbi:MAG: enoyl-CoA hydratase/isomerase family protein [Candidatus Zixiibacteriota bacterium]
METIRTENRDGVAVVTLNRRTTNAINRQLVDELTGTLRQIKGDSDARGAVLTSSNEKFFSIGLDIPQLFELNREDFGSFYRAFNRLCIDLYTLPKPLVAAITGHATAGGCILALCCDYRFIAQGRKLMGMNEIKLGVPVPYPIDCIFRQLVGVRIAREVVDSGEFYPPDELIGMGMVDQVLPLEQVLPKSIDKVRLLGSYPQEAVEMIKRNRTEAIEAEILARLKEREELFIECWYSDEVRKRLKEAMEKF